MSVEPHQGLPLPRFKDAEPILAAADRWKQRCLLGEGSILTNRSLWTLANFQELQALYVEKLDDESSDSFVVKLRRQLGRGPADAKCLWAEMTWVYRLIQGQWSMGAESKRTRIRDIWNWSERDFPEDHELLGDAVLGAGVVHPGTAYNTLAWMEFRFFVVAMRRWFSLQREQRESLLGSTWEFASWLDNTEFATGRMFRHALLFLLFPKELEPIVSNNGKRRIVKQLHQGDRVEPSDAVAVDQALLAIRQRLEKEYPDEDVHFYASPFKELWQDPPRPKPPKRNKKVREKKTEPYRLNPDAAYTLELAHQDLFIPPDHFTRLLTSLKSRKNLVLQGPPGTGKTFIARRLAWCLIGRKDNDPIEMVQFHQSYAYEDFVQGYRPTDDGGFKRKDGVFHRFCERARANPDTPPRVHDRRDQPRQPVAHLRRAAHADRGRQAQRGLRRLADLRGPRGRPLPCARQRPRSRNDEHRRPVAGAGRLRAAPTVRLRDAAARLRNGLRPHGVRKAPHRQGRRSPPSSLAASPTASASSTRRSAATELGPGFRIGHSYFVPSETATNHPRTPGTPTSSQPRSRPCFASTGSTRRRMSTTKWPGSPPTPDPGDP